MADDMFKTTLMGGFDKDDVLTKVQAIKDEAYAEKSKLLKANKEKDAKLEELHKRLELKDVQKEQALAELREEHEAEIKEMEQRLRLKEEQKDKLEREIHEKYQKYIDRYDLIGSLVLEAQEKAEGIISEAEAKRDEILTEADIEAEKRLAKVQSEVDDKLAEGKRKYIAVQEELNEIVELINQAQRRFMSSYKEVHRIISTMPESMRELEDETGILEEEKEFAEEGKAVVQAEELPAEAVEEQESLDEMDDDEDHLENAILRMLEKEELDEEE